MTRFIFYNMPQSGLSGLRGYDPDTVVVTCMLIAKRAWVYLANHNFEKL